MAQRVIQLLRSGQVYATKAAAKSAIEALTGKLDGEVILARYTVGAETKTLISVRHSFTPTGGETAVSGWTFFDDPESLIAGLDKSASAVDGQVVTTVTQADGLVSETKANVKDLQLGGYSKDTSATGAIGSTDTVNTALSKLENQITSVSVTSTDKTVNITNGRDLAVNIDGTTIVKNSSTGVISSDLKILKETTGLDTNVREQYKLVYGSSTTAIGDVIKIYKDSALVNFQLGHVDDTLSGEDPTTHESSSSTIVSGTGDTALVYVMQLENGNYKLAAVNVESFLQESEFKDGLDVDSTNHEVSVKTGDGLEFGSEASGNKSVKVKIDANSEKDSQATPVDFLTVTSNGVKVQGIKDEIGRKIAALDVTTDTAVAGQYVAAIEETDGVVAVKTRANVSDAVLTGYTKGSSAPASTDVTSSDDVKGAIAKLEWQIDAAESGSKTEINTTVSGESASHMTITKTTSGHDIYSFELTDVASQDGLEAVDTVIGATKASGSETRSITPTTNYGTGTTTVMGNMQALDTAIKANADAIAGLDYTDTAVAGQVVTEVDETNGVIAPTRANLSGITLAGYTADTSASGDIAATDTVAVALNKLQNKADASLNSVSGSNAISVGTKDANKDQQISLILDDSTTQSAANNQYAATSGNVLQITSDGLYLSEVWDCGTYA